MSAMQRAGEQISGTGAAARYAEAVPRYTSYPTAPHFHAGVTGETFRGWLAESCRYSSDYQVAILDKYPSRGQESGTQKLLQ